MTDHLKGLLITATGVLFVVPDSLFVRLIEGDPASIAFWRGITAGSVILMGVLATQRTRGFRAVAATGARGWLYTVLLGVAAPGFVLAVSWTSVANVVFILASMPVFAAILSRFFLGEAISARMVLTMIGVFGGLALILRGSGETQGVHWSGDLVALAVSASFAGAITTARRLREVSLVPTIPVAMLGASLFLWPLAAPGAVWAANWPLLLAHGAFISVATSLMTLGPRYITAPEVALLILLESVLAPLLVWAILGEGPGAWAIIGGTVVISVLLVSNLWALRMGRRMRVRPHPRTGPPV
ncbi:MAG: EamA family transporter [Alphaproteobacteria bacterium HGW-Alphaproteobacteria-1]|nr:MAG: EamA family transporter [Alphaproteobacteria bacterium HGW-Alphaproteobacteria-1]